MIYTIIIIIILVLILVKRFGLVFGSLVTAYSLYRVFSSPHHHYCYYLLLLSIVLVKI